MIHYGRHDISEADIAAVSAVLRSDFLTQGAQVPAFEAAVAARCGARHAVASNSATSALHLACLALGAGPGTRVWTVPNTFVASANCALYCGAEVDFVDIDPATGNLCVDALAARLDSAAADGTLPRILIPVHFGGQSCDMRAIHALASRHGVRIIEDASHAVGAEYDGGPVGDCRYSDITVFSFHPVKIITTAEGGLCLSNDDGLAATMARLRSHGITKDATEFQRAPDGPWHNEQQALGFNYRMNDLEAALGLSQLQRLDEFVDRRRKLAARYDAALAGLPVTPLRQSADGRSSYHLYVLRLPRRDAAWAHLQARGIAPALHYIPVYRHPYHAARGYQPADYPGTEQYYAEALTLPLYPGLSDAQQAEVIAALADLPA